LGTDLILPLGPDGIALGRYGRIWWWRGEGKGREIGWEPIM